MPAVSKIEWTDYTFNPWIGCQKVSLGCDNCYAEAMMDTRFGRVQWGPHGERKRTSPANWHKPIQWNEAARKSGRRAKVFCASLADWLDNKVPTWWRGDLADTIDATPYLDWLLLTKRPENFERLSPWENTPRNVWLGTTAEDMERFRQRWAVLRRAEATVRFISYEPALGPLSLFRANNPDWIICGGESGPKARPMDPEWARNLRDQCASEGVAFFMKQMARKAPIPADLMVREWPNPEAAP